VRLDDLSKLRMANHAGGWAPGMLVRFGSLDFIITTKGGLEQIHVPARPIHASVLNSIVEDFGGWQLHAPEDRHPGDSPPLNFNYERLGHQLRVFLGPQPTQEDLYLTLFSLANVTTQLSGGEPLSPEIPARSVPTRFHFGLRNAAGDAHCLAAVFFGSTPTDGEFVGMTDYISKSFHDLHAGESEVISDSGSSEGSHHPSRECFMVGVPEGRVKDAHSMETPPSSPNNGARERNQAPPPARLEQLQERQKELE
jgi:hypothetical protein